MRKNEKLKETVCLCGGKCCEENQDQSVQNVKKMFTALNQDSSDYRVDCKRDYLDADCSHYTCKLYSSWGWYLGSVGVTSCVNGTVSVQY